MAKSQNAKMPQYNNMVPGHGRSVTKKKKTIITTQNISGINYFEKNTKNIIVSIHTWSSFFFILRNKKVQTLINE